MTRALGVGIDEFDELRTNPACLYIDKTAYVAALASALLGRQPRIFLARPRRFGKTLLTSTLEALFQGRRDLFAGTWLDRKGLWAWDEHHYPVLRLGLGLRDLRSRRALATALAELVADGYERAELDAPATQSPARMLSRLLKDLQRARNRKVVVLIDEYDTPVTENIDQSPETLQEALSLLRAFYGALKNERRSIRCVFMTGITRLSKAGLFSGANHFYDITFAPQFNALLGFTHAELTVPAELATDLARCADNVGYTPAEFAEALRAYYNGYRFAEGGETVYNPHSVSVCLADFREAAREERKALADFPNAWAESGHPALLFRLLRAGRYALAEDSAANSPHPLRVLMRRDLEVAAPDLSALMFHAGYLTLKRVAAPGTGYRLDLPNQEVQATFHATLREWQQERLHEWRAAAPNPWGLDMRQALREGPKEQVLNGIDNCMQQLPHDLYRFPEALKTACDYEMYYQNLLYAALLAERLPIRHEEAATRGRIDLCLHWPDRITALELKASGSASAAIRQAWIRGYVDPYRTLGKPVAVIGLRFDVEQRTVIDIERWALGRYDVAPRRWDREPLHACTLTELSRMEAQDRVRAAQRLREGDQVGLG